MASQSHAQHQQAKEAYRAKENSWRVQPMAANRQIAGLEERLALEAQLQDNAGEEVVATELIAHRRGGGHAAGASMDNSKL